MKLDQPDSEAQFDKMVKKLKAEGIFNKPHKGTIKFYNPAKGYGFIEETDLREVFFHITHYTGSADPVKGGRVSFEITPRPQGQDMAVGVRPIEPSQLEDITKQDEPRQTGGHIPGGYSRGSKAPYNARTAAPG